MICQMSLGRLCKENKIILFFACVSSNRNSFAAWETRHILKSECNQEFHISYQSTLILLKPGVTLCRSVSPTLRPNRIPLLIGLSLGSGSCHWCYAGTPGIAYALLCCPSSRKWGGWSPPRGPRPVNLRLLLAACRGPHPLVLYGQVAYSRHQLWCRPCLSPL